MSCSHPISYKNHLLPCGKCINCRRKKINDWAVRLELERKLNKDKTLYVTLTYAPKFLPESGCLEKKDYQEFLKKLRREIEYYKLGFKVRYFLSGEYGSPKKTFRPHFHLILFGMPLNELSIKLINQCWKKGFTCIKSVTFKNCRYVAKYCAKSFQKVKDGVSEFVSMSTGQGIGYGIFKYVDLWKQYVKNNYINCNGYSYSIPYSLIKKAKQLNLDCPQSKCPVVLYNDLKYKSIDDFKNSDSYSDMLEKMEFFRIYSWQYKDFKYEKFSDYFKKKIFEVMNKEIDFCKVRNIDYSEYYKKYRKWDDFEDFYYINLCKYYCDNYSKEDLKTFLFCDDYHAKVLQKRFNIDGFDNYLKDKIKYFSIKFDNRKDIEYHLDNQLDIVSKDYFFY